MENITSKLENGVLTLCLSGRIDSANAAECEAEIVRICDENQHSPIVIDGENL